MKTTELADDATVRQKLTALRERILKGEDFAGLAQTTSEDPGSAAEGGDLGWAGPGTFAPEFEQAIAGLKDNEISEPFHTQFGWHIAQVLGHSTVLLDTQIMTGLVVSTTVTFWLQSAVLPQASVAR